jgi:hypothetical protein
MKRILTAIVMVLGSMLPLAVTAAPAGATCAPPSAGSPIYSIRNATTVYYPTNVMSSWVYPQYGSISISYSETKTAEMSASVTATVSAEASAVFASASSSLGVTVGGSWSRSSTWSYTMNVDKDPYHWYRGHLYHYSKNFQVMKKSFNYNTCLYVNKWSSWQDVNHAPVGTNSNVWKLDQKAA